MIFLNISALFPPVFLVISTRSGNFDSFLAFVPENSFGLTVGQRNSTTVTPASPSPNAPRRKDLTCLFRLSRA